MGPGVTTAGAGVTAGTLSNGATFAMGFCGTVLVAVGEVVALMLDAPIGLVVCVVVEMAATTGLATTGVAPEVNKLAHDGVEGAACAVVDAGGAKFMGGDVDTSTVLDVLDVVAVVEAVA